MALVPLIGVLLCVALAVFSCGLAYANFRWGSSPVLGVGALLNATAALGLALWWYSWGGN